MHISRTTLDFNICQLNCTVQRYHFTFRPVFSITAPKVQGQTLEYIVERTAVYGVLYISFSRVKVKSSLKVLLSRENSCNTLNIG